MCRIPKIALVADEDVRQDLRKKLSSLEYDIVAAVGSLDELSEVTADAVILWKPEEETIVAAKARGLKTASLGGADGADLKVSPLDPGSFKTRVWELFRPSG